MTPDGKLLPLIVIGGGGHAKVLISVLLLQKRVLLGYVDVNRSLAPLLGVASLGDDSVVFRHAAGSVQLINGVGSARSTQFHEEVFERFAAKGYAFETVVHPGAIIAPDADLEEGVQVMAGAVVQTGVRLGKNAIINTSASVDHDCVIEAHAHIAPGVTLAGAVHVGAGSFIGAGATVIQGVAIGCRSIVGAGAVVIRDVPAGLTVAGVPAAALTHSGK